MAQHGYLHDSYDSDDFDRDEDRERGWRDRDRDERAERSEHGMFGWRDEGDAADRGGHRGFSDRGREEDHSWGGSGGDRWNSARRHSAHPDDHYRSWRDKQIEALDRDYEEYCREREQQFHQDFDSWRQNRQQRESSSSEDVMTLDTPATSAGGDIPGATTSPIGSATLGTNNSENTASAPSATGRGRR